MYADEGVPVDDMEEVEVIPGGVADPKNATAVVSQTGSLTTTGDVSVVSAAIKDTAMRRVLRTVLQVVAALILGGAFDVLVKQVTDESPASLAPVVTGLWFIVVVAAQNWAENSGVISPILGTKPDVKNQTL